MLNSHDPEQVRCGKAVEIFRCNHGNNYMEKITYINEINTFICATCIYRWEQWLGCTNSAVESRGNTKSEGVQFLVLLWTPPDPTELTVEILAVVGKLLLKSS
jgi:hypothetical protein